MVVSVQLCKWVLRQGVMKLHLSGACCCPSWASLIRVPLTFLPLTSFATVVEQTTTSVVALLSVLLHFCQCETHTLSSRWCNKLFFWQGSEIFELMLSLAWNTAVMLDVSLGLVIGLFSKLVVAWLSRLLNPEIWQRNDYQSLQFDELCDCTGSQQQRPPNVKGTRSVISGCS